jgi:hypothetical protein
MIIALLFVRHCKTILLINNLNQGTNRSTPMKEHDQDSDSDLTTQTVNASSAQLTQENPQLHDNVELKKTESGSVDQDGIGSKAPEEWDCMIRYEFTVTLAGYGSSPEAAWNDAVESFYDDPGEPSEPLIIEDEEEH